MLHGEIKVNDFVLLRWQADNVNNTHITPVVYEVTATGLDEGHRPFHYEFQMLAGNGYLDIVTTVLAEVAERAENSKALRMAAAVRARAED